MAPTNTTLTLSREVEGGGGSGKLFFGPYDLDLKKGVDFGLKNSVYLDLNSFALSNFDLKPKLCQQCT